MSTSISLPNQLYERVQQTAENHKKTVDEYIAELISTALDETDSVPDTGDEAMTNAALVWDSLYPILKEKYPGQYVAVYQGRVVDVDENALTLNRRLQKEYPNKSVWVGQIEGQPFPEIHMRSPHIER